MKKTLWIAAHLTRNYKTEPSLTSLLYKSIQLIENCESVEVDITWAEITITTNTTSIIMWNANKFYAWISSGSVNGRSFSGIMPSRAAAYDFKECLRKKGYDIYVKRPSQTVSIYDLGC